MKRFIGILLLVLGSCAAARALPQGWEWVMPQPQGYLLTDVSFADEQNGWAVGEMGALVHTTDGGASWETQNSGTELPLVSVDFISATQGWIVADSGRVLRTTDGGTSWSTQVLDHSIWMEKIQFADADHGWICTAYGIYRTTDGGVTWTWVDVTPPEITGWSDLSFVDALNGWMVSATPAVVTQTTDGGVTWTTRANLGSEWIISICFVDSLHGWLSGSLTYRTVDGGSTWIPTNVAGYEVYFADQDHGWVLTTPMFPGEETICYSANGGVSWTQQFPGDPEHPWNSFACAGITAISPTQAVVVGQRGFIIYTTDAGQLWNEVIHYDQYTMSTIDFLDANAGWAAGSRSLGVEIEGVIFRTGDGGLSWTESFTFPQVALHTVQFADSLNGWVLGYHPETPWTPFILHTANGGLTWEQQQSPVTNNVFLSSISMVDSIQGWITGYYYSNPTQATAFILHTVDGGANWAVQDSSFSASFLKVAAVDASHAWVTADGTIRYTANGGATWVEQTNPVDGTLMNIQFTDLNHGWATLLANVPGGESVILGTSNGGTTWTALSSTRLRLDGPMKFIDNTEGWVSAGFALLHTIDAGTNWAVIPFNAGARIAALDFVASNNGWLTTDNSCVLHYRGTQTNPEAAEQPLRVVVREYGLMAYPNPFNPSTRIELNLARAVSGQLVIYDLVGRQVRTLAMGQFEAGKQSYIWTGRDASDREVSAGVYFCRFSADKISATQKLILLK